MTSAIRRATIPVFSAENRLFTPPKNPFHCDPLKGVIMRSSEEVDRKLNQVLTEIRTIQVELNIVKRAVDESRAADVGMASMTAEDIDLKFNKILERLASRYQRTSTRPFDTDTLLPPPTLTASLSPLPRRHRLRIGPQAFPSLSL